MILLLGKLNLVPLFACLLDIELVQIHRNDLLILLLAGLELVLSLLVLLQFCHLLFLDQTLAFDQHLSVDLGQKHVTIHLL